jgi:glycosidase
MEFHIARGIRENLDVDGLLFGYTGNVLFADVVASRKLAVRLNNALGPEPDPADLVNAGALFAMGMIDELNHALIARYREEIDPSLFSDAIHWFTQKIGSDNLERLLLAFTEQFPNVAVYRGELSAAEWLAGTTDRLPNREAALEELMLLWLSNINPAFTSFLRLFDDSNLKIGTAYPSATSILPDYLNSRPPIAPEIGSVLQALTAPMLASPDSITGQLEFIRENWPKYLGQDLNRVLLAIDVLREEDVAIWMRFHPPGPAHHRHGAPGWGAEGFVGNEFIGFDEQFDSEFVVGPDGVRHHRYAKDYQAPLNEYEAFSADQAWMPNVVLIAKSTYVWLEQLSKKHGRHIHHLDHIPDEELELIASRGITGLWLIGLWERSLASRTIKRLRGQGDAVASAYSLKDYNIAEDLGGPNAYANLRDRAARHGIRLASDMVPNHMGIDSPWVIDHPNWFIWRPESPFPVYKFGGPDISPDSRVEIKIEDHYYDQTDAAVVFRLRHHHDGSVRFVYHGNDGTSFAWNDTAQLDYSQSQVREHVIQTILHVARQFPIIRFDAAMVLAKRHVQRLWFPLPGAGGSIPSRAENAISQEQFDALMPHEFWREVVDRVAAEVPGTLLLAEAFWLLEGYFVRTLGMHRVYNSAFMNMLRDEENAKYRSYLKKTIEFDPDILKRYVNFMSNPDEKTAIDQFGSGDKYFGTCTLLATLPGLPMFGHGQIEGLTERYGMEFKRAKMDEYPNEGLIARHQHDIAPLLKNRQLFADSTNFVLYDFWTNHGSVDENVFVFSNRLNDQRALIFYNNRYGSTQGTIHVSASSMNKASGSLQQTSLTQGLGLHPDHSLVVAYRDNASGLEFLRRVTDLQNGGLSLELRGYQYVVLLHWRELRSTFEQPWDRLCDALGGRGVHSVDETLSRLRLRPLHEALRQAISPDTVRLFNEISDEPPAKEVTPVSNKIRPLVTTAEEPESPEQPAVLPQVEESQVKDISEDAAQPTSKTKTVALKFDPRFETFVGKSQLCFDRAIEILPAEIRETITAQAAKLDRTAASEEDSKIADPKGIESADPSLAFKQICMAMTAAAVHLSQLAKKFSTAWPPAVRYILPNNESGVAPEQTWAPVVAWIVLQSISTPGIRIKLFDELQLRSALAEIFASMGIDDEKTWRIAARIRVLLLLADSPAITMKSASFWADPDVRWLAGVNESSGKTYFNKEQFEELLCWLQLPSLLKIPLAGADETVAIHNIENVVSSACADAVKARFSLASYLQQSSTDPKRVS